MRNSNSQSCGCLRLEKLKEKGAVNKLTGSASNINSLFGSYKRTAKKRNIIFDLTKEEFSELIDKNCFYCDEVPKQKHKKSGTNELLLYNGVDRLNNDIGYKKENSVTCCKTCNYAKRQMSINEFYQWIERVYKNGINGKSI